jgi:hypothetical protein
MGVEREIAWAQAGINCLIHSADIIAMKQTLTADVRALRTALGDNAGGGKREAVSI